MDGNADTLQGGRDDMRGVGARTVSPFLRGFSPASFVFCVFVRVGFCWFCGFGLVLFFVCF